MADKLCSAGNGYWALLRSGVDGEVILGFDSEKIYKSNKKSPNLNKQKNESNITASICG